MAAKRNEYADYIADVLGPLGPIRLKAMFGGYGIYCDELFFALIIDDTLYFKADDSTRAAFESEELPPFTYEKEGKVMTMSYYQASELIFEDSDALRHWGNLAIGAALRARKPAKTAADKPAAKKTAAKKTAEKKPALKKTVAKKAAGKKAAAKSASSKQHSRA